MNKCAQPPPIPNGEGIPPGTYLTSCNGCNIENMPLSSNSSSIDDAVTTQPMLNCMQCPKACGKMVQTNDIPIGACESFGNDNGWLVCDMPVNADDIPLGTYIGSCGGCKMEKHVLSCSTCKTSNDGTKHSTFTIITDKDGNAACKVIGNIHGELTCEDEVVVEDATASMPETTKAEKEEVPVGISSRNEELQKGACRVRNAATKCEM